MLGLLGSIMIAAADVRPLPTAMHSLSERELRSRIVGKQIRTTTKPPPGLDYVTVESFTKKGRYYRSFHGHDELGTYRFVGDMICVQVDGPEECRAGLADTNGDLWLLSQDADGTRLRRHAITDQNK
jgi:hypothetical protein